MTIRWITQITQTNYSIYQISHIRASTQQERHGQTLELIKQNHIVTVVPLQRRQFTK